MSNNVYKEYAAWKKWSNSDFMRYSAYDAAYYSGELRDIEVKGRKILEVGFGNGSFIGYARDRGAQVFGTELIPEAIAAATAAGVQVYSPDLSDAIRDAKGEFHIIVALDVLEHLTLGETQQLFTKLAQLLRPGGRVLARFPNGASPLGCVSQSGDYTHRSVLSANLLMQLLIGGPWRLVRAGNPYRVNISANPIHRLGLAARHGLRGVIEKSINSIYGLAISIDPNVCVVIERLIESER